MERDYSKLLSTIKHLPKKEKEALVEQIMKMMASTDEQQEKYVNSRSVLVQEHIGEYPDCPHCHAKAERGMITKKGMHKGSQRYYCKSCGRKFVSTTNTAFCRSRKSADEWKEFILLTISGETIKKCAIKCNIAYQTAFTWRHKVLNAFKENQASTTMTGKIEVDEMLIPLSFKGNHIKGSFHSKRQKIHGYDNGLPRESYQRGTDNKPKSSKERACVFCMVENGSKDFYASVPGVGFMLPSMLDKTIKSHVDKDSAVVVADQYKVTQKYLEENNYAHIILSSNTSDNSHDHKPEIRDGYHMQHVNSMHYHIRNFLRKYYGVSSKYLENYISMFVWLKKFHNSPLNSTVEELTLTRAAKSDCYITRKELESYPAIPMCA